LFNHFGVKLYKGVLYSNRTKKALEVSNYETFELVYYKVSVWNSFCLRKRGKLVRFVTCGFLFNFC